MSLLEAIVLGVLQGLTEFLPVSSSGHLELATVLFGISEPNNLQFVMAVHAATVLSTIVVFWGELGRLLRGILQFRLNSETVYGIHILVSMIPIAVVGFLFRDQIEALFSGNLLLVGCMLLVTALLLTLARAVRPGYRSITMRSAFLIGVAQALAVVPGLSRSGSTVSTGLLLGVRRDEAARFSFLMVLIPILGMNFLEIVGAHGPSETTIPAGTILAGAVAAFVTGTLACRWMVSLVSRGRFAGFAVYCTAVGLFAIVYSLLA